jgi:hypothetical protein
LAKETLVRSEVEIWGRTENALSRARIPVTLFDWNYVPELDQWQLTIATPWYDNRGPREANARVISALQDEGIYPDVPMLKLFVRSPEDPVVKTLERELRSKTEGAIHIVQDLNSARYRVLFSPFSGPGGAIPAKIISGRDELRLFLEERLYIAKSHVDDALAELNRKHSASILPVHLTKKEAKVLGLA